ncbi:hypothetical protein B0T16DRAFT_421185 [Cercophora newfieldiana]|uniref:Uncharacterized protein n=1 Tax=Cercophora newfieldiana TaxID=92897 RepID=A0AA40CKE7_9PEZI|nr:hypothetical protein B0T16DRAFT_421185 [Cercophora newfieldiana]
MHFASVHVLPALLAGVQLAAGAALFGRSTPGTDTCVADDLLRCLRLHRHDATPFCRDFLSKVETVLVTETVTVTHSTLTTETNTATSVSTSFEIGLSTITVTSTSVSVPVVTVKARDAMASHSFSQFVASYPPESVSSACSCLTVPMCIKKPKTTSSTTTTTEDTTETQTTTTETTTVLGTVVTSIAVSTTTEIVIPTYPTRPFRMYSLDDSGARLYLDRRDWVQGDAVASTTDASLAETFVVDADQHLFYTDGFGTATIVYAWYGPTYFDDNLAKVVYFNTPAFITAEEVVYHEWTVDLDTLSITLVNPSRILQLCNRVYSSMLMVGLVVDSNCVAVSLFMEYIV